MKIEQSIDFANIINQMEAFVVYLDDKGLVTNFCGNSIIIGTDFLTIDTRIIDLFPEKISKQVDGALYMVKSTGIKKSITINYLTEKNKFCNVKLTIGLTFENDSLNYLLTFTNVKDVKPYIREVDGNKSYEEAIRQLSISEDRYNSYFENDPVMHISINPETGLVEDCNSFTIKKLQYHSKNELIGKPIYAIYSIESKQKSLDLLEKFRLKGSLQNEEMKVRTKKGKIITVLLYTIAQYDEKGNIILSRSTLVDISQLKNTQKKLRKKRSDLEILNRRLEQFVSTCSHDLQEPLATIKFAGDVLNKLYGSKLDQKGKDYLSYIDQAIDRLSNQIKMLLEHAKIGNNANNKTKVDIESLLKTVIQDLGKRINETKTNISFPEKLPVINVYETELRLLFQNLLSNSIKYSKKGIIPIITIEYKDLGNFFEFIFRDNGIGISESDTSKIFEVFNKVNNDNPNKGTGLGLAHCKKIVKMHSGVISVKSKLGIGSQFKFTIKK